MDSPHENLGAMPSTQDQFQAVGLDFDQLGMFSDLISGQSNSADDFQQQIDSGMASPSSSISGGVPLSAEVENNAAIPPGPAEAASEPEATVPSKIGSRFTSGAIKVLRTWFERHEKHPYPTPKDVDRLQNQTGLERQQITNWFANTRRRKKFRPQEKPVEDRTFYRKDHLRQHLKLVHGSNQMTRLMDKWKVVKNNIRSACGFCGAKLETWEERGDHLADHFKNGSTMTDWQGDWGFEPAVMEMLDNAMPPYLIRFESVSALPFTASVGPADTAPSAYELLKLEIEYYIRNYFEGKDSSPSDDELKYEGCSIIFGAEFFSSALGSSPPSWLRDIFMCSTEIATKARFRPMQQLAKLRLSQLRINGKMNIFEECQLESELRHYIGMHVTLGLALSDHEIQREACAILARVEESSNNPSRRVGPVTPRVMAGYRRLAKELSRFVASTMSPNNPNSHIPTDEEIRHQARWVLYDDDDPWNQTPADVEEWLLKFKKDVGLA
ncbi:hypothetical protein CGMCC3_g4272 [Colletotrichum fructicola]|uniref:Homeobox protein 4 n=1 Tax=Colletotrichum fructicola (strain Nara gc5) TaxID=1213859 RepID=A0A7J6JE74_COLFN|nr:uncharacterized protein CGMCC3_g4272 [Colletotrichum fructicola]KAE9579872.1 hypothetical protein CGMCC3_g4272 [Colletotrichum fructicola]KAF4487135.1 Homeobox protein 4 [Colletotrichum fructicola Nara gc5]